MTDYSKKFRKARDKYKKKAKKLKAKGKPVPGTSEVTFKYRPKGSSIFKKRKVSTIETRSEKKKRLENKRPTLQEQIEREYEMREKENRAGDISRFAHGGMMGSPSLLNKVKTSYEMGGVMKMYGKGGTVPNKFKGFSKLPESVQQKMNPEMSKKYMGGGKMKEYGEGGAVDYGHGGIMRQHD
tara:strand:+ start:167 stop:715 length:549 start_codon:yes stop_codon:yes gene_type:complete